MKCDAISYILGDIKELETQIDPDGIDEWAVRYLWIQHRWDNSKFTSEYFTAGHTTGLNVRKQTTHLGDTWKNHNRVFDESAANGNLVWRVKAYNSASQSIDYIEVWRSLDVLRNIFGGTPKLESGDTWTQEEKERLGYGIWESGFEVRHLRPFVSISKDRAIEYYWKFVERWRNKDNCIINTKWNEDLNPFTKNPIFFYIH